jgi:hypothetical protein
MTPAPGGDRRHDGNEVQEWSERSVCTDDRYLKAEGLPLSIVKGCVPVDGDTYDVPMQITTVEQNRKDAYRRKFGDHCCRTPPTRGELSWTE